LWSLGTVGVTSRISLIWSRMTTLSASKSNESEVSGGAVTTRIELDKTTERRVYVLSFVQRTASSPGWPLIVNLERVGYWFDRARRGKIHTWVCYFGLRVVCICQMEALVAWRTLLRARTTVKISGCVPSWNSACECEQNSRGPTRVLDTENPTFLIHESERSNCLIDSLRNQQMKGTIGIIFLLYTSPTPHTQ